MGLLIFLGALLLVICVIVGSFGQDRKMGFAAAFFCSLFFTPILAMLFVLASERKSTKEFEDEEETADFIDDKGRTRNVLLKTGKNAGWTLKN